MAGIWRKDVEVLQHVRSILAHKKTVLFIKIGIALAIFWLLAQRSQFNLSLFYSFWAAPFNTLVIILLCYLMVVTHAWRWYRFNVVQGIRLSFADTIMPTYLGVAFNTVLPGSVGGDFVRFYYVLKKFPQQKTAAAFAILVDRISGLLGIFIIGSFLAPYYLDVFRSNKDMYFLLLVCMSVCIGTVLLFMALLILCSERLGFIVWLERIIGRYSFMNLLLKLLHAIQAYKNAKLMILESLIVSIFTQFLLLIVVLMIGNMMDLPPLSLVDYTLALVIGQVANLVPLTPGGVGIGEAAFANIIHIVHPGIVGAYATVFFGLRLISALAYLPGVFLGIFGKHLLSTNVLEEANELRI